MVFDNANAIIMSMLSKISSVVQARNISVLKQSVTRPFVFILSFQSVDMKISWQRVLSFFLSPATMIKQVAVNKHVMLMVDIS